MYTQVGSFDMRALVVSSPRLQAKLEKPAGGIYFPNYANNLAEEQREIETSISFEYTTVLVMVDW